MSSPADADVPSKTLLSILSEAYPVILRLASDFAWTPTLYLLSPVIAIGSFAYTLLLEWPVALGLTFLDLVHPLYTFFGAALLIAAILGAIANATTWFVQYLIAKQRKKIEVAKSEEDSIYIKTES